MACEHGWHSEADCDACTASRVIPAAMDRIAELEAALRKVRDHLRDAHLGEGYRVNLHEIADHIATVLR